MMPKLTQPEYYEGTKYGYARGGEAVVLVESVRQYFDMLNRLNPSNIPSLSTSPYFLQIPSESKLMGLKIK
jgi:membrane-bound lytic murein transglycosylase F